MLQGFQWRTICDLTLISRSMTKRSEREKKRRGFQKKNRQGQFNWVDIWTKYFKSILLLLSTTQDSSLWGLRNLHKNLHTIVHDSTERFYFLLYKTYISPDNGSIKDFYSCGQGSHGDIEWSLSKALSGPSWPLASPPPASAHKSFQKYKNINSTNKKLRNA